MIWVDTHCHLDADEFNLDRAEVWRAAQQAGVSTLVIPAVSLDNCAAVDTCCQDFPGTQPAYGIHPLYAHSAKEFDLTGLATRLSQHRPLALGEIGLDGQTRTQEAHWKCQSHFFVEQLKLAREYQLPVLLHVRQAVDAVLQQLRRYQVPGGIAHAFNGSRQQADEFLRLGFKLGFGGTLSYPGSHRIRQLAVELPLEALVLETDAPDIPPSWRPRQRNTPDQIPAIGQVLADLRGLTLEEVATATQTNARMALPGLG